MKLAVSIKDMDIIENISRNIADFRRETLEVEHFLTGTLVSYDYFKSQYPKILNQFNEKVRDSDEKEGMEIFRNLNLKISDYESDIYTFCFINLIARTEAFLNDVLETLYLWNYNLLLTNKTIDHERSIDRDKIILKFSHSSFKEKMKFLKNKFNLTFPLIEKHYSDIIELFTTRNIILHNNGIVNATYLKLNENSKFELDAKRTVNKDYLKLTFLLLIIIAKSIEEQIKEQLNNVSS